MSDGIWVRIIVSFTWTMFSLFTGIPFNDTNFRLGVAEAGQKILGPNLLGLQLGNEPDLYGRHGRRDPNVQLSLWSSV
jgi:hypothetical protein